LLTPGLRRWGGVRAPVGPTGSAGRRLAISNGACYTSRTTDGKIGNSIGLILPKELLAQTGFAEGDKVEAILQPDGGIRLKPHDDLHARSMEIARRAMKQYAGALRELAK
jgi:putative addiction module antidote